MKHIPTDLLSVPDKHEKDEDTNLRQPSPVFSPGYGNWNPGGCYGAYPEQPKGDYRSFVKELSSGIKERNAKKRRPQQAQRLKSREKLSKVLSKIMGE